MYTRKKNHNQKRHFLFVIFTAVFAVSRHFFSKCDIYLFVCSIILICSYVRFAVVQRLVVDPADVEGEIIPDKKLLYIIE